MVKQTFWRTWNTIFPLVEVQILKGKWYAVVYAGKRVAHLFVARIMKRFILDENGLVEAVERTCFKEKLGNVVSNCAKESH